MVLYQYRSISSPERMQYLFDLLRKGSVRFSAPSEFNDPFDCCPTHLSELPDDAFPHAVGDAMNLGLQAALSKLLGVWCLTPHPDRMLMWSHYADQHRGVCIGFDAEVLARRSPVNDLGHSAFVPVRRVAYMDKRPDADDPDAIFVKSPEWRYEDEYRVVSHRAPGTPVWGPGVWSVPVEAIVDIVFGARIVPDKVREIAEVAAGSCPDASLRIAVPDMKRFGLRIEALSAQPTVGVLQGFVADPGGGWLDF